MAREPVPAPGQLEAIARPGSDKSRRPTPPSDLVRRVLLIGALVVVVWSLIDIDLRWDRIPQLPERLLDIAQRMFLPPDFGYTPRAWAGMLESIHIAWVGTLIGGILSIPLAFLAAHNISSRPAALVGRQILNAIRAIPELILALVFFIPMVGLGAFAGTLAIGIHSSGMLGKLSAEVIEGIDPGPAEAAQASGGTWLQVLRWGVLPQILPETTAFWLYRFEINIRASAILGLVGAGGVGTIVQNTLAFRRWDKAGMTILVVIAATMVIDAISSRIRSRIISGAGPRSAPEEAEAA